MQCKLIIMFFMINKTNYTFTDEMMSYREIKKLIPEKVISVTRGKNNEVSYLIKWKNKSEPILVPTEYAKYLCPYVIIDFYESKYRTESH